MMALTSMTSHANSQLAPVVNYQLAISLLHRITMRSMFNEKHWKEVGARITAALEARGKTQAWLTRELGQTSASVSKICARGTNRVETLAKICLLLQCSMDELVFGSMTRLPRAEEKFLEDLKQLMQRAPSVISEPKKKFGQG